MFGSRFEYEDNEFKEMVNKLSDSFNKPLDGFCIGLVAIMYSLRHIPPIPGVMKTLDEDVIFIKGTP